jgi:uncharacterized protein (TIGR04255 family)
VHYHHNHLALVVLRFDFEPIKALREILKIDVKPDFSAKISDIYPVVTGQPTASLSVMVGPSGSGINQQITGVQWTHRKVENGTRAVVLTADFLSVEYGNGDYDHFPPFRAEVEKALQALQELYHVPMFARIGLRYVNNIVFPQGNALDWGGLVSADLIKAVLAGKEDDANVVRSMHQLHVRGADCDMLFNYGLHNPDYPNALVRRAFVLDFDSSKSGVEAGQALTAIDSLNKICETMFEHSIDQGLREQLGMIHE